MHESKLPAVVDDSNKSDDNALILNEPYSLYELHLLFAELLSSHWWWL